GAERAQCRHEELAVGQRCPVCGQGTLYELPPGVEIRIDGHGLLSAMRYELQKLRCSACGQMFTAPLPREAGEAKYRPRARALLIRVGEQMICLYDFGRSHAGENLAALLAHREADQAPPIVMSDALSRNEVDEEGVIRCHCLAHGRRQFSDIAEVFPSECQVVIDALKQVFDHDAEARDQQMSPQARLAYHQTYSQPLMDELKDWLAKQVNDRLVEPNSSLGQALAYMQKHWATLT